MNGSQENQKCGKQKAEIKEAEARAEWWAALPAGERMLLFAIGRVLRSAKRSRVRGVAPAARKWGPRLCCFMKAHLLNARRRRREGI
jgi:hypothetical protein